jgi:YD repeat-containing protein
LALPDDEWDRFVVTVYFTKPQLPAERKEFTSLIQSWLLLGSYGGFGGHGIHCSREIEFNDATDSVVIRADMGDSDPQESLNVLIQSLEGFVRGSTPIDAIVFGSHSEWGLVKGVFSDEQKKIFWYRPSSEDPTTSSYDDLNRLTSIETDNAAGQIVSSSLYALNPDGARAGVTDNAGRTGLYAYDPLGRLVKETILDPPPAPGWSPTPTTSPATDSPTGPAHT